MTDARFDEKPIAMLRRVGREALASKMIELFLTSGPQRVSSIEEAVASGDIEAARRAAHSLKPSAGQLGAVRLSGICQRIEDAAGLGDGAAVGALVPDLRSELALAIDWLKAGARTSHPTE